MVSEDKGWRLEPELEDKLTHILNLQTIRDIVHVKDGTGPQSLQTEDRDIGHNKDRIRSVEMRETGNSLLKARRFKEALQMYNMAVLSAPIDKKVIMIKNMMKLF